VRVNLVDILLGGMLGFGLARAISRETAIVDSSFESYYPTESTDWKIYATVTAIPRASKVRVNANYLRSPADVGLNFLDEKGNVILQVVPVEIETQVERIVRSKFIDIPRGSVAVQILFRSPDGSIVDLSRVSLEFVRGLL